MTKYKGNKQDREALEVSLVEILNELDQYDEIDISIHCGNNSMGVAINGYNKEDDK
jgi:hypothetical protein